MEEEAEKALTHHSLEFGHAPSLPMVPGGGRCLTERNALKRFYYKCQKCQKQYTSSIALKNHSDYHHSELPIQCQFCYNRFTCKFSLSVHTKDVLAGNGDVSAGRSKYQWDFKFRKRPDHDAVILEQNLAWDTVLHGIHTLIVYLDKLPKLMCSNWYLVLFRTLYFMKDTQYSPYTLPKYDKGRFDKYREKFEIYLSTVLPEEVISSLEKYYLVVKEFPEPPHKEIYLQRYRELVYPMLKAKVKEGFKYLITEERKGYPIDRALLKDIIHISVEIRIEIEQEAFSQDRFRIEYLKTASLFYRRAFHGKLSSLSSYLLEVDALLKREKDMASYYLRSENDMFMFLETLVQVFFNAKVIEFNASKRSVFELLLDNNILKKSYFDSVEVKVADMVKMYQVFLYVHNLPLPGSRALEMANLFKKELLDRAMKRSIFDSIEDKESDLATMYQFLSELPESGVLKLWADLFDEHQEVAFTVLFRRVMDAEESLEADRRNLRDKAIKNLIEFSAKWLTCLNTCFLSDFRFLKRHYELLYIFFNKNVGANCSFAKILARFLDNCALKAGNEKLSDVEDIIHEVLEVYPYMRDKVYFGKFYMICFAKRLFYNQGFNAELEKKIWKRFYDYDSRTKLRMLMKDLSPLSQDQATFTSQSKAGAPVDFTVTLVRKKAWPYGCFMYPTSLEFPPDLAQCAELFTSFDKTLHQPRRRLAYMLSFGTCKLKINGIELIMSTSQAIVLLLYNEVEILNFKQISAKCTHLKEGEVISLLESLCGEYQILKKCPKGKKVIVTDSFIFNSEFSHQKSLIQLPPYAQVDHKIFGNGHHFDSSICCTILETLRAKKFIPEVELMEVCEKQTGFSYQVIHSDMFSIIDLFVKEQFLVIDKNLIRYLP